jgi:hypothetical protein
MRLVRKPTLDGLKKTYYSLSIITILAGLAAKWKNDGRKHRTHDEHETCKCPDQCFRCLID